MTIRNNVTRLLDANEVLYQAFELPDDEKRTALETASLLNAPEEQVFKTIVITRSGRGKTILAVVPGPSEVDLKAVAAAIGEKKVNLPTQKEAEQLTRLQSGGISALALINQGFDVLLDEFALAFDRIYVSGGQRGLTILLPVQAFIDLTGAVIIEIAS